MVARLTRKIGDRVAWRRGAETAAADKVEAKRHKAATGKDDVAKRGREARPVIQGRQVNGTRGKFVVEGLPGEAGGSQVLKQTFVAPGSNGAGFHIREREQSKRLADMKSRASAKSVRVEVAGDNGRTGRKPAEKILHLNAAATSRAEDFKMDVRNGERAAQTAIETNDQGVTVAFASFDTPGVIEACGQ